MKKGLEIPILPFVCEAPAGFCCKFGHPPNFSLRAHIDNVRGLSHNHVGAPRGPERPFRKRRTRQIAAVFAGKRLPQGDGNFMSKLTGIIKEYALLTASTLVMVVGIYFFKFPNNFCFGGVTGLAVILSALVKFSASSFTFIINMVLLLVGFLFVGKSFGVKTVYVSVLMSVSLSVLDKIYPMTKPLTNQPVLELLFAIFLPALGSAMLFNEDASSGGTDILAMILKKYTSLNIGVTLMLVDVSIVVGAFLVFGPTTGLFSVAGLLAKTLVIDTVVENINLCKYFTVVCDDPKPICDYIHHQLHRSATVFQAEGTYSNHEKQVILTVMRRGQAVQLRKFIRDAQPQAFIMITNSSEIIGKGFRGVN